MTTTNVDAQLQPERLNGAEGKTSPTAAANAAKYAPKTPASVSNDYNARAGQAEQPVNHRSNVDRDNALAGSAAFAQPGDAATAAVGPSSVHTQ